MRKDASINNRQTALGSLSREAPTATQLVELLQAAYPINWEQLLAKRLGVIGVTDPVDLITPAQLDKFRDQVFQSVRQVGIADPAAWIAHRAQLQPKSADCEPVAKSPPTALSRSASVSALDRMTKTEMLSRAKTGVEAGVGWRDIAEILACAQEHFHVSQREIAHAIGRSASSVNRLLKWRGSGYQQSSPFGPTTRAGRAAHRTGRAEQPKGDNLGVVEHCLPQSQPTSLAALNENLPTASAETEVLSAGETANGKIKAIEEEAAPAVSGADQSDKQQPSAEHTNSRRKLTPERMRIVIEALRECPLLEPAAAKAGIHRKTLEYWLKCSKAGRDGYDVDWEDFEWRFHEACEVAVEEAHQRLLDAMFSIAMGPPTHKVDDQRVMNFAERHTDAYARAL
jgi:hypothetical protein